MNNLAVAGSGFAGLIYVLLSENFVNNTKVPDKTLHLGTFSVSR